MDEPWYEARSPGVNGVIEIILREIKTKKTITDEIKTTVKKIVTEFYKYQGVGSYRGYYTFDHKNVMKAVYAVLNDKESK